MPLPAEPRAKKGGRVGWSLILIVGLVVAGLCLVYYRVNLVSINQSLSQLKGSGPVQLRLLPFPYQAGVGLTISPEQGLTLKDYVQVLRYLDCLELTPWGMGLGLDAGGSFLFYPPTPEWTAYFNPPEESGRLVRRTYEALIRAGLIDVLDSFGADPKFDRDMAVAALAALAESGLSLTTWADRFTSLDNLVLEGGRGSHPGRMAYHLDLTLKAGFKYFWLGRTSPFLGQEVPIEWGLFQSLQVPGQPTSWLTVLGAMLKHFGLVLTSPARDALRNNQLLAPVTFRDGSKGYEYIRYQPPGQAQGLAGWLSQESLDRLVAVEGKSLMVAGLSPGPEGPVGPEERAALVRLAQAHRSGRVLVCSASRLLTLSATLQNLRWRSMTQGDWVEVVIDSLDDPLTGPRPAELAELAGVTFYVPDAAKARLVMDGREVQVKRNLIDHTGRESISVPWPTLKCPDKPPLEELP